MPPMRTMKPVSANKTERSHAENQERAYIAASRRSDRSLEARVESARRASEIHKRRTGRSLRVTEEDVLNEEMYEEEDDRLPMHYQRLAAHLDIGSASFKARLAAYLTNHASLMQGGCPSPGNMADTFGGGGTGLGIHTNDWLNLEGATYADFSDLLTFTGSPGGGGA
ncbi:hypothetical protein DV735_g2787, partial [Chaetothyriales sp. CBS 134920]